jgi:hypothetical protein
MRHLQPLQRLELEQIGCSSRWLDTLDLNRAADRKAIWEVQRRHADSTKSSMRRFYADPRNQPSKINF